MAEPERSFEAARIDLQSLEEEISPFLHQQESFSRAYEVSLLSSICSLARSTLILHEAGQHFDAEITLRAFFEYSIELDFVLKNPEHHNRLQLEYEGHQKKILTEAENGNPYYRKIASHSDTSTKLSQINERIASLKFSGVKEPQNLDQKYQTFDRTTEYESVYRSLCRMTHPTYAGAIKRNLRISPDKSSAYSIELYPVAHETTQDVIADALCGVLRQTLQSVEILKGHAEKI
ncbi:hypothetical protein D1821_11610 [Phaeobacter inhibens]|uniref:DUF5677 domain-containing protein n=1 Tax=Phaeobacter inhibens TaxID=221822 RepID=UPI000160D79F|nr:DUF5677 domain-containing protein [Phaeobacter inhibens]AXT42987.1 hypothetical protein D1821_11610 [Phaeobacter inhibens]